jgi:starch phosphorylase
VSSVHGEVSRAMWMPLYPAGPGNNDDGVPIGHITNGVHVHSWLAPQMRQVFDRHFGPDWPQHAGDQGFWEAIDDVDDGELWETHQTLKVQLIEVARRRAAQAAEARGDTPEFINQVRRALSLDALTIGFARRFATYKRANLILQDMEAIVSLVNDAQMPIQFVFAGKSHPHDRPGKEILHRSRGSCAIRASPASCSSSRITTSTSAAISSRASTCGSTIHGGRSRRAAPAGRRSC